VDNPIDRKEPNGVCVRLYNLQGDKRLCEERDWIWGKNADIAGRVLMTSYLKEIEAERLSPGKYRVQMFPAWKGNEIDPHDFDEGTVLSALTFIIKKETTVRLIED